MNDPSLPRRGAWHVGHIGHFATIINGYFERVSRAVIIWHHKHIEGFCCYHLLAAFCALIALAIMPSVANAQPQIKVNCDVYATNQVDPIAFSEHLHHQIGNTSTTNKSTGESLEATLSTSCDMPWFTTAGWFPVERYEPVRAVNVYYRAPGDQTKIKAIPTGLQLLGTKEQYNCNDGAFQNTPPYSCRGKFATRVTFPDCWNKRSLEETSTVYGSPEGVCPSSHPYRLPRINFLVMHDNADGVVANPLLVSAGLNSWEDYTFMHADYFAPNQDVFNNKLLDLCLRNAHDSVTFADDRCGVEPGS